MLFHKTALPSGIKVQENIPITQKAFTPSAPIQEWERDEISEAGARYYREEDPGVVGHDTEHQHVAQGHLQKVEERLSGVKRPAEKQMKRCFIGKNTDFQVTIQNKCPRRPDADMHIQP